MGDGREPDDVGLAGLGRSHAHRRQRRHHGVDQEAVLLGLLVRAAQAGGEGVVLVGGGAPAHGAGHGAGRHLVAPATDQQLGARSDEAAGGIGETRRVAAPEPVEDAAPVEGDAALDDELPGQHDLADVAGADGGEDLPDGVRPLGPAGILPPDQAVDGPARCGAPGARRGIPAHRGCGGVPRYCAAPEVRGSRDPGRPRGSWWPPTRSRRPGASRAGPARPASRGCGRRTAGHRRRPVRPPAPLSPVRDGPSTVIDASAPATRSAARSKRPGLPSTGSRAATPAVTNPAPPRSQANPSLPRTSRRSSTSPGASTRVRLTRCRSGEEPPGEGGEGPERSRRRWS